MEQYIAGRNEKTENTGNGQPKNKKPINKDLIFYSLLMIWPVLQFVVFYIGVNANSILMAFQKISYVDPSAVGANGGATVSEPTLEQFRKVFKWFSGYEFRSIMWISVKFYLYTLIISVPLGLLFSYYIYKKFWMERFSRDAVFAVHIIGRGNGCDLQVFLRQRHNGNRF